MARIAILVVAAGKGERVGGAIPKQYVPLLGQAMLRRSIEAFGDLPESVVQVMIGPGQQELYGQAITGCAARAPEVGGATRQESVWRGLEALADDAPDFVLIHDAARPLVSRALIDGVIGALEAGADAAVPLLPVADTLRKQENGKWITVPRAGLLRAQTPQGFRYAAILKAHRDRAAHDVTDDMALAELAGLKIVAVPGEETNIKVTNPEDFAVAESLLSARLGDSRTGFGFDVHRFVPGDHVWLCGLKIPHDHALEGHSDADAGLHALTDAILGAIGEGDIGLHFPPTDERWRGAPSWKFLEHAAEMVQQKGGIIVHCDVTLICERPKITPHREAMRAKMAEILHLDVSRVSVKATTTEGLGFAGRREGLAAQAIATVRLP
ncbi:MAG: bifunctional 2-C-methyl-D-erythritol 4-phosphate cytidylyltransferase/2-C-methyl-D-erythritol 2,4-cyclodiphosphate synthase [Alphaproteobacteria bacterium]|nr:bifunctional 2-C-methyl-D-erythritol 4-phosphate cytidylyltransferase/2-C-methyl-D-erythritol 2,4-cyclodiphosphate synthase [Alphaproteobacteria bacterium]MDE2112351.1 bifunctional 2-C-methyl-D-erythritol 4-phosphate cytidylyltransferase/2-C-methyl-D-erythritol 2,4-cyclodiphosphate synthase [Alphaproteobacteria bacterium]MDE2492799.1 bifunctional 2-C-methyl-D-erythritol 4-phosphate cytidylyltransferase/2-C-methyl-D-erythritol 2,4-cyclodiphosphate synthase [Alphaproteobacteria bacterium]